MFFFRKLMKWTIFMRRFDVKHLLESIWKLVSFWCVNPPHIVQIQSNYFFYLFHCVHYPNKLRSYVKSEPALSSSISLCKKKHGNFNRFASKKHPNPTGTIPVPIAGVPCWLSLWPSAFATRERRAPRRRHGSVAVGGWKNDKMNFWGLLFTRIF